MHRVGGLGLAERLRARWPGRPVLFMTGHTEQVAALEHSSGPSIPILLKPFAAPELLGAVANALSLHRPAALPHRA